METYHFEAVERVNTSAADVSHQHECTGSSKVMIQSVSAAACHLINIGLRISLGRGCICSKVEEVGEILVNFGEDASGPEKRKCGLPTTVISLSTATT